MTDPLIPLDPRAIERVMARETHAERLWKGIPFLGWMIADGMWQSRNRPVRNEYVQILDARSEALSAAWGDDPAYRAFARTICEIAREEMGWPNARFIPSDSYQVVFWAFDDGLDLEFAMMEIEDRLDIDIGWEGNAERWYGGDFGAFVREIFAERRELL